MIFENQRDFTDHCCKESGCELDRFSWIVLFDLTEGDADAACEIIASCDGDAFKVISKIQTLGKLLGHEFAMLAGMKINLKLNDKEYDMTTNSISSLYSSCAGANSQK